MLDLSCLVVLPPLLAVCNFLRSSFLDMRPGVVARLSLALFSAGALVSMSSLNIKQSQKIATNLRENDTSPIILLAFECSSALPELSLVCVLMIRL